MAKATCSRCGKTVHRSHSSRPEIVCHECRRKNPAPKYRPASCEHCGTEFRSQRNGRSVTGWTRYCSRTCVRKARVVAHACGTDAGYNAHLRDHQRPCNSCRKAHAEARFNRSRAGSTAASRRRRLRHQASWDGVSDEEILERDRWMCWICKRRISKTFKYPHPRSASIDHLIPLALGGDDTAFNKKAAHLSCNMSRGTGRQDEHPMLNFSLDPDAEIRPRARRLPVYTPRPCKICGELREKGLACSLHEPVRYGTCKRCSTPIIKRGRTSICQACERCAADGCRSAGSFGRGYCAPHYHRLNRYGDAFSDIPLAQGRRGKLEVAALIRLRLAKDAAA